MPGFTLQEKAALRRKLKALNVYIKKREEI